MWIDACSGCFSQQGYDSEDLCIKHVELGGRILKAYCIELHSPSHFTHQRRLQRTAPIVSPSNQWMAVSARALAESQTPEQRSKSAATRIRPLSLPDMISTRFCRLYRRLSYLTGVLLCVQPALQARIPLSCNASRNRSASWPRSLGNHSTFRRSPSIAHAPMPTLTCPAVTIRLSERLWLSQMACDLVFVPRLVRPIRRPPAPFFEN